MPFCGKSDIKKNAPKAKTVAKGAEVARSAVANDNGAAVNKAAVEAEVAKYKAESAVQHEKEVKEWERNFNSKIDEVKTKQSTKHQEQLSTIQQQQAEERSAHQAEIEALHAEIAALQKAQVEEPVVTRGLSVHESSHVVVPATTYVEPTPVVTTQQVPPTVTETLTSAATPAWLPGGETTITAAKPRSVTTDAQWIGDGLGNTTVSSSRTAPVEDVPATYSWEATAPVHRSINTYETIAPVSETLKTYETTTVPVTTSYAAEEYKPLATYTAPVTTSEYTYSTAAPVTTKYEDSYINGERVSYTVLKDETVGVVSRETTGYTTVSAPRETVVTETVPTEYTYTATTEPLTKTYVNTEGYRTTTYTPRASVSVPRTTEYTYSTAAPATTTYEDSYSNGERVTYTVLSDNTVGAVARETTGYSTVSAPTTFTETVPYTYSTAAPVASVGLVGEIAEL